MLCFDRERELLKHLKYISLSSFYLKTEYRLYQRETEYACQESDLSFSVKH